MSPRHPLSAFLAKTSIQARDMLPDRSDDKSSMGAVALCHFLDIFIFSNCFIQVRVTVESEPILGILDANTTWMGRIMILYTTYTYN